MKNNSTDYFDQSENFDDRIISTSKEQKNNLINNMDLSGASNRKIDFKMNVSRTLEKQKLGSL